MEMPPGYRFYPTEEELVGFYLREKLQGRRLNQLQLVIPMVDIYDHSPWELPQLAGAQCRQDPQLQEWFFFIPRQEKEARGGRPNRLTSIGYWKATGSPGYVYSSDNRIIGEKRTMVFYKGRAPGVKTDWKMNEYRAIDHADSVPEMRLEFSLCRVYIRSKCIRSYDRRPPTSAPGGARRQGSSAPSPILVADNQNPTMSAPPCHRQNPPTTMTMHNGDGSGSSRENSSSSDDQNASLEDVHQAEEHASETPSDGGVDQAGFFDMGDAPLWEWEHYLNPADWMVI